MSRLRGSEYIADRDMPVFRELIQRWRHVNGLVWGMSVDIYGHAGAWSETLGIIAPLQEMMLQSWDGILRVFPAWPRDLDARIENLRAEGAFLVSATWNKGKVTSFEVFSERGQPCRVYVPWETGMQVVDSTARIVNVIPQPEGFVTFATRPGIRYTLQPQ